MKIALGQDHTPRPSMTPIIDVVFNLLIFFLLASQFARAEREQLVYVPQVSFIQPVAEMPRNLLVNVTAEGRYVVMTQDLSADALDGMLREAVAVNPDQQVIIRCDGAARFEAPARVMELCNKNSIKHIAVTLAEKPK